MECRLIFHRASEGGAWGDGRSFSCTQLKIKFGNIDFVQQTQKNNATRPEETLPSNPFYTDKEIISIKYMSLFIPLWTTQCL